MKRIFYAVFVVLLAVGCNENNHEMIGEIEFQISSIENQLKNSDLKGSNYSLDDAVAIILTIKNYDQSTTDYSSERIDIYRAGDTFVSQKLSLNIGDYFLEEFYLINDAGEVIYATPYEGSLQAQNVLFPLPIEFSVEKDQITKTSVEVISTEELTPEDFGLVGFTFTEVNTFSFLINVSEAGNLDSLITSELIITSGSYTFEQELNAENNLVTLRDEYSEYTLQISKQGYSTYSQTFTQDSLKYHFYNPLTIELTKGSSASVTLYSSDGKDAQIWSYDPTGTVDRGTDWRDIVIYEWTYSGSRTTKYGLLDFDFSDIPEGSTIVSAKLSLYHDSGSIDVGHSQISGSNEAVIQRITSNWTESIAWDNKPSDTEVNQVYLPASTSEDQDYLDINVTALTQDIINDKSNSFGFIIKLVSTEHYRSLIFASGDNPDSSLHPRLEIEYAAK